MFSVGLLYSARDFLQLCKTIEMTSSEFKSHFENYKYSASEKILEISFKCGWIKITSDGVVNLKDRGVDISNCTYQSALILQLEDLIMNYNPSWASLLTKGRTETKNFLPPEALQCFREAGLFESLTSELIQFWDKLSMAYRNFKQKKITEIGREGEKLSYEYEFLRVGKPPLWQAVESNLSGFDILSYENSTSLKKLQIEVKASSSHLGYAKLHLTRNEWITAQESLNYIFHLWLLGSKPKLHLVTVKQMIEHVPIDSQDGEWEVVEIPFVSLINE